LKYEPEIARMMARTQLRGEPIGTVCRVWFEDRIAHFVQTEGEPELLRLYPPDPV
jgi:hypothetical protein